MRARSLLVAHTAALPRGNALRHPARIRYSVFEHTERASAPSCGLRGHGCPGKIRGAQSAQRAGPIPPALRYRICGMGAGRPAAKSAMHVITQMDPKSGALFARNPYNTEFRDRVAFFDVDDTTRTVTAIGRVPGRNGSLRALRHDAHAPLAGWGRLDRALQSR